MRTLVLLSLFSILSCSSPSSDVSNTNEELIPLEKVKLDTQEMKTDLTDSLQLSEADLLGKLNPASDERFSPIATVHTSKSNIYLRNEAYVAFILMYEAAKKEDVNLKIISATRNFDSQKGIWEAKWTGARMVEGQNLAKTIADPKDRALKILRFSSMPGTSRHHWGTDIDLNNLNNSWFASGEGKKIYDWLISNASTFGFCQVYSPKGDNRPNGYEEEKWHWSYLPLANSFLRQYKEKIRHEQITGFKGSEAAELIGVIEKYVGGINPACK